jgi:hypothetical protein
LAVDVQILDKAPSKDLTSIAGRVGNNELRHRLEKSLVREAAYEAAMADDLE